MTPSNAFAGHDVEGNYLHGGKPYKVTLPARIPGNNFWSFVAHSNQHRSMLETDQKLARLDSNDPSIKANEDGSYTARFRPEPPDGKEGNWIQIMPKDRKGAGRGEHLRAGSIEHQGEC